VKILLSLGLFEPRVGSGRLVSSQFASGRRGEAGERRCSRKSRVRQSGQQVSFTLRITSITSSGSVNWIAWLLWVLSTSSWPQREHVCQILRRTVLSVVYGPFNPLVSSGGEARPACGGCRPTRAPARAGHPRKSRGRKSTRKTSPAFGAVKPLAGARAAGKTLRPAPGSAGSPPRRF